MKDTRAAVGAQLQRLDLAREAIRLTRGAKALLPDDAEVAGLLALMLLTDARRAARTGPDEELIPLDKQDRTLWDQAEISEGIELLTAALSKGSVGLYQLQAAIAAVHDEAARAEDTDWPQILASVRTAETRVSQSHGDAQSRNCGRHGARPRERPRTAEGARYRRAARWSLSSRCGSRASCSRCSAIIEGAIQHYRIAAGRTTSLPEQNYLMTQAARLAEKKA